MSDAPTPTLADNYKALARTWAATVTVITMLDENDALDGFTATAFLTVSIDPPIVLVSVQKSSLASSSLSKCKAFAVNLLAPHQADVANTFARPQVQRQESWASIPFKEGVQGAPLLQGTAGAFTATVRQVVDAGDHVLVLGDVTDIHVHESAETLMYHNRKYGKVAYHD